MCQRCSKVYLIHLLMLYLWPWSMVSIYRWHRKSNRVQEFVIRFWLQGNIWFCKLKVLSKLCSPALLSPNFYPKSGQWWHRPYYRKLIPRNQQSHKPKVCILWSMCRSIFYHFPNARVSKSLYHTRLLLFARFSPSKYHLWLIEEVWMGSVKTMYRYFLCFKWKCRD
jgi:hypothetical protein